MTAQPNKKPKLAEVLKLVDALSPEDRRELRLELDSREPDLNFSHVDFDNPLERAAFYRQEQVKAGKRVEHAFERLQTLGIMDKDGNLLKTELPADMQPGSACDVGG